MLNKLTIVKIMIFFLNKWYYAVTVNITNKHELVMNNRILDQYQMQIFIALFMINDTQHYYLLIFAVKHYQNSHRFLIDCGIPATHREK